MATFLLLVNDAKDVGVGFGYVRIPFRRSSAFRSNSCWRTSSDTSDEAWQTKWHKAFLDFVVAILVVRRIYLILLKNFEEHCGFSCVWGNHVSALNTPTSICVYFFVFLYLQVEWWTLRYFRNLKLNDRENFKFWFSVTFLKSSKM